LTLTTGTLAGSERRDSDMDGHEIKQVADFLLDGEPALWGQDGTDTMLLYLHPLYDVPRRLVTVAALTDGENLESTLRTMGKKAQTPRRQVEERLAVRN
jgi:hypothetical protein